MAWDCNLIIATLDTPAEAAALAKHIIYEIAHGSTCIDIPAMLETLQDAYNAHLQADRGHCFWCGADNDGMAVCPSCHL
jgi:hypothetical protein